MSRAEVRARGPALQPFGEERPHLGERQRDVVRAQRRLLEDELKAYEEQLAPKQAAWEASFTAEQLAELRPELKHVIENVPVDQRNSIQRKAAERAFRQADLGWSERQASIKALV